MRAPAAGGATKQELRRLFRQRRRQSLPEAAPGILATAQRHLGTLLGGRGGDLGLYWPIGSEPDLRPLVQAWSGRLALPAVADGALVYRAWVPGEPLANDACGIPAPLALAAGQRHGQERSPGAMALLLVPALAVAPCGLRLGSGGGWYDRLRADPLWAAVPALAVLPAACTAATLPRDPWDIPFDGWIDEWDCHLTEAGWQKIASS
ncbi:MULTISPECIES: 5-formyltetrahydrofolate cyclo-ligase [unclassified Cyanobium]|uniref:5-formyltetrahydrofolate cyclo-ligase n=1 Tax=unclassified Cyanobium TaxID=2627006 RepID=UPI0020CD8D73|nr:MULTISPECIES: 5-formyltetrahydrofolate cyclo-ligase [unclassified Cyanobium]MCP9833600.1 5-formyltetrahydrofolate cyclo-ligase [Cyanobium sp. La Preciosa 7G6]MCP9936365.1 5-formyltetrahydrofolate cyclo-ligase [Cyanobium sp. Aljojuca 7A6]